jgi:SNF2 family DNA or RNA helicase
VRGEILSVLRQMVKLAEDGATPTLLTPLLPHQQRVVDKIKNQPGIIVVHGLGSGKTLTSIGAQTALNTPTTVVVPAALQENYRKELSKHTTGLSPEIRSMQDLARKQTPIKSNFLVVDEAHRAREPGSATYEALRNNQAQKRMLLTASPFYNHPADIAPLINLAAGKQVLPGYRKDFESKYIATKKISPGFFGKLRGVSEGEVPVLNPTKANELSNVFKQYVDYYPGSVTDFPDVKIEDVKVPMTKEQLAVYDSVIGSAPAWVRAKVLAGLPPSKKESKDLNAFLGAARQVANSTRGHSTRGIYEPKIDVASQNLQKFLGEHERNKAVVYSNYLDTGINPYKEKLDRMGIQYGEFTGDISPKERDRLVREYNENKLKVLLLSSAGGEGLDLKGTRLMQVLEPHWNIEKIKQVQGRGARYKSHVDLPPELQNMVVQRYLATRPESSVAERLGLKKPGGAVDEYLQRLSSDKETLIKQFQGLFPNEQNKAAAYAEQEFSSSTTKLKKGINMAPIPQKDVTSTPSSTLRMPNMAPSPISVSPAKGIPPVNTTLPASRGAARFPGMVTTPIAFPNTGASY